MQQVARPPGHIAVHAACTGYLATNAQLARRLCGGSASSTCISAQPHTSAPQAKPTQVGLMRSFVLAALPALHAGGSRADDSVQALCPHAPSAHQRLEQRLPEAILKPAGSSNVRVRCFAPLGDLAASISHAQCQAGMKSATDGILSVAAARALQPPARINPPNACVPVCEPSKHADGRPLAAAGRAEPVLTDTLKPADSPAPAVDAASPCTGHVDNTTVPVGVLAHRRRSLTHPLVPCTALGASPLVTGVQPRSLLQQLAPVASASDDSTAPGEGPSECVNQLDTLQAPPLHMPLPSTSCFEAATQAQAVVIAASSAAGPAAASPSPKGSPTPSDSSPTLAELAAASIAAERRSASLPPALAFANECARTPPPPLHQGSDTAANAAAAAAGALQLSVQAGELGAGSPSIAQLAAVDSARTAASPDKLVVLDMPVAEAAPAAPAIGTLHKASRPGLQSTAGRRRSARHSAPARSGNDGGAAGASTAAATPTTVTLPAAALAGSSSPPSPTIAELAMAASRSKCAVRHSAPAICKALPTADAAARAPTPTAAPGPARPGPAATSGTARMATPEPAAAEPVPSLLSKADVKMEDAVAEVRVLPGRGGKRTRILTPEPDAAKFGAPPSPNPGAGPGANAEEPQITAGATAQQEQGCATASQPLASKRHCRAVASNMPARPRAKPVAGIAAAANTAAASATPAAAVLPTEPTAPARPDSDTPSAAAACEQPATKLPTIAMPPSTVQLPGMHVVAHAPSPKPCGTPAKPPKPVSPPGLPPRSPLSTGCRTGPIGGNRHSGGATARSSGASDSASPARHRVRDPSLHPAAVQLHGAEALSPRAAMSPRMAAGSSLAVPADVHRSRMALVSPGMVSGLEAKDNERQANSSNNGTPAAGSTVDATLPLESKQLATEAVPNNGAASQGVPQPPAAEAASGNGVALQGVQQANRQEDVAMSDAAAIRPEAMPARAGPSLSAAWRPNKWVSALQQRSASRRERSPSPLCSKAAGGPVPRAAAGAIAPAVARQAAEAVGQEARPGAATNPGADALQAAMQQPQAWVLPLAAVAASAAVDPIPGLLQPLAPIRTAKPVSPAAKRQPPSTLQAGAAGEPESHGSPAVRNIVADVALLLGRAPHTAPGDLHNTAEQTPAASSAQLLRDLDPEGLDGMDGSSVLAGSPLRALVDAVTLSVFDSSASPSPVANAGEGAGAGLPAVFSPMGMLPAAAGTRSGRSEPQNGAPGSDAASTAGKVLAADAVPHATPASQQRKPAPAAASPREHLAANGCASKGNGGAGSTPASPIPPSYMPFNPNGWQHGSRVANEGGYILSLLGRVPPGTAASRGGANSNEEASTPTLLSKAGGAAGGAASPAAAMQSGASGRDHAALMCSERLPRGHPAAVLGEAGRQGNQSPLPPLPRPRSAGSSGSTPGAARSPTVLPGRPAQQPYGQLHLSASGLAHSGCGYSTPPYAGSAGGLGGSRLGLMGRSGWGMPWPAGAGPSQQYDTMIEDVINEILGGDSPDKSCAAADKDLGSGTDALPAADGGNGSGQAGGALAGSEALEPAAAATHDAAPITRDDAQPEKGSGRDATANEVATAGDAAPPPHDVGDAADTTVIAGAAAVGATSRSRLPSRRRSIYLPSRSGSGHKRSRSSADDDDGRSGVDIGSARPAKVQRRAGLGSGNLPALWGAAAAMAGSDDPDDSERTQSDDEVARIASASARQTAAARSPAQAASKEADVMNYGGCSSSDTDSDSESGSSSSSSGSSRAGESGSSSSGGGDDDDGSSSDSDADSEGARQGAQSRQLTPVGDEDMPTRGWASGGRQRGRVSSGGRSGLSALHQGASALLPSFMSPRTSWMKPSQAWNKGAGAPGSQGAAARGSPQGRGSAAAPRPAGPGSMHGPMRGPMPIGAAGPRCSLPSGRGGYMWSNALAASTRSFAASPWSAAGGGSAGLMASDQLYAGLVDVPRPLSMAKSANRRFGGPAAAVPVPEAPVTMEQQYREALINLRLAEAWEAGERWARCDLSGLPADTVRRPLSDYATRLDMAIKRLHAYRGPDGVPSFMTKVDGEWEHLKAIRIAAAGRASASKSARATPHSHTGVQGGVAGTPPLEQTMPFAEHMRAREQHLALQQPATAAAAAPAPSPAPEQKGALVHDSALKPRNLGLPPLSPLMALQQQQGRKRPREEPNREAQQELTGSGRPLRSTDGESQPMEAEGAAQAAAGAGAGADEDEPEAGAWQQLLASQFHHRGSPPPAATNRHLHHRHQHAHHYGEHLRQQQQEPQQAGGAGADPASALAISLPPAQTPPSGLAAGHPTPDGAPNHASQGHDQAAQPMHASTPRPLATAAHVSTTPLPCGGSAECSAQAARTPSASILKGSLVCKQPGSAKSVNFAARLELGGTSGYNEGERVELAQAALAKAELAKAGQEEEKRTVGNLNSCT